MCGGGSRVGLCVMIRGRGFLAGCVGLRFSQSQIAMDTWPGLPKDIQLYPFDLGLSSPLVRSAGTKVARVYVSLCTGGLRIVGLFNSFVYFFFLVLFPCDPFFFFSGHMWSSARNCLSGVRTPFCGVDPRVLPRRTLRLSYGPTVNCP